MTSMELTEFLDGMGMVQCAVALAVPAVLGAVINLGCGKKREPVRPVSAQPKNLDKSSKVPGGKATGAAAGKSSKSKRSTKSMSKSVSKKGKTKDASTKDKSSAKKSKRSTKSSKDKSATSKKSKREVIPGVAAVAVDPKTGKAPPQQPSSGPEAGKGDALATAKLPLDASAKGASSQRSLSVKQPGSGAAVDANVIIAGGAGLKMQPDELRWSSSGGMQKISLLNQSSERRAIKVKCSDNTTYRVNPVYAIVEPGQTLNVDVMRQNGANKVDKIVFVTTKAGIEENPKNLFKPGVPSAMMVLPLLATAPPNQPIAAIN